MLFLVGHRESSRFSVHSRDLAQGPHLDPQAFQIPRGPCGKLPEEGGNDALSRFHKDDPGQLGVNVAEVPDKDETAQLADGPGELHIGNCKRTMGKACSPYLPRTF